MVLIIAAAFARTQASHLQSYKIIILDHMSDHEDNLIDNTIKINTQQEEQPEDYQNKEIVKNSEDEAEETKA